MAFWYLRDAQRPDTVRWKKKQKSPPPVDGFLVPQRHPESRYSSARISLRFTISWRFFPALIWRFSCLWAATQARYKSRVMILRKIKKFSCICIWTSELNHHGILEAIYHRGIITNHYINRWEWKNHKKTQKSTLTVGDNFTTCSTAILKGKCSKWGDLALTTPHLKHLICTRAHSCHSVQPLQSFAPLATALNLLTSNPPPLHAHTHVTSSMTYVSKAKLPQITITNY